MKNKFLPKKEFDKIYSKVPRLCVDLVITKGKKILLTKRSIPPFKGMWHLPGGGIIYREKIEEGIHRVARSELGVNVKIQKFLGYIEILKEGNRHAVILEFKCEIKGNKEPKLIEQASEIKFFNKIPRNTIPKQKEILRKNRKKIFE